MLNVQSDIYRYIASKKNNFTLILEVEVDYRLNQFIRRQSDIHGSSNAHSTHGGLDETTVTLLVLSPGHQILGLCVGVSM